MNHTEQYTDEELQEMKERCLYMITSFKLGNDFTHHTWAEIYKIALIEINRELDMRKLRKEMFYASNKKRFAIGSV